jgi:hypothetical protein|eukprot:COSAG01_NODE_8032_length_2948_cov_20.811618_3_plen_48_part_00
MYHRRLEAFGVRTRRQVQQGLGHAWVRESAAEITAWLKDYGTNTTRS